MRRRLVMVLVLLAAPLGSPVLLPAFALAQEDGQDLPPFPRPRPERDSQPGRPAAPGDNDTPATEAIDAITSAPQTLKLSARIDEEGAPIREGVVWRIFDTQPDSSGELALVAKSDDSLASVELPPGEYVVHVAYGRAQASETVNVAPGNTEKSFVLEAGAIRLNASVTGDIPISPSLLTFDILTGGEESRQTPIAEGLSPNEIVTLNAGTYHVVSHFGTINAVVRADLRVEPGQLTDATLYHHASEVSFRLVSEQGGEAIADVDWTVQTAEGETVFTNLGAFPSTVLGEGQYVVLAKRGEQVFNREFQIQAGSPREIEVLTTVY